MKPDTFAKKNGHFESTAPAPAPSTIRSSVKGRQRSPLTRGLLLFSPSVAPARFHSMDFRQNPTQATQVFQGADVHPGQSGEPLGNAREHSGAHE